MKFAREQYSLQLVSDMLPLWVLHYDETQDSMYGKLDPDLGFYERAGHILRIFTARDSAGHLKGYQTFFVCPDPHSRGMLQAVQDILYVSRDYRGLIGYRFIDWCGEQLELEGVDVIHQRISARHDFGPLLKRLGYELEDLTYSRRVKKLLEV